MRNEQRRTSPGSTFQCIDNSSFGGGIQPAGWFIKDQNGGTKLIRVLLPAPVAPTIAIFSPGAILKLMRERTDCPEWYSNETSRNSISPFSCDTSRDPWRSFTSELTPMMSAILSAPTLALLVT